MKHTHLNAEFQRIARRDKKAFLSDQCKEREGNNRMEKTRDLFKKTRDTKGTFHAKIGTIKERNSMDLTEADGEALYSQQTQDRELSVAQIMNSLLPNSALNGRK